MAGVNVKPARHVVAWLLRATGYAAITLPWGIYVLRERMRDEALIAHERVHEAQMHRMGVGRFYVAYLWLWLRYGYREHPMEREARGEE